MHRGFIKLFRKITDWEWYSDSNVSRVFIHLLLTVNHKKANWRGIDINEGEKITSLIGICEPLGMSIQQVRTALGKLKKTQEIEIKSNKKHLHIRLCNYASYGIGQHDNNTEITSKQHCDNIKITTNKNVKNEENVKNGINRGKIKRFTPPSFEDVKAYCEERGNGIDPQKFTDHYEATNWYRGKNKIKDWKACVRTWEGNKRSNDSKSTFAKNLQTLRNWSDKND